MLRSFFAASSVVIAFAWAAGCAQAASEDASHPDEDLTSEGGSSSTGGGAGKSGASTGGTSAGAGGTASTGGASAGGSSPGTGGATGGSPSTGGSTSAGGSPSTGGGTSTGGTTSTGGGTSAGGGSNACSGVTCASPPPNACADASTLTVYSPMGTCSAGQCAYGSSPVTCPMGCQNGACVGDPCIGVTCASPPANTCSDGMHLQVFDSPGTCANGVCSYGSHSALCNFGCMNAQCVGDPCAGLTCTSPPKNYCKDASTLAAYSGSGTCTNGVCGYTTTDQACPHGCVNDICLDCSADGDCAAGKYCGSGSCTACNVDQHCGASCTDCAAMSQHCDTTAGACVECLNDAQCGAGKFCNAGACATCDTDAHCGASCGACSGATPTCAGGACQCNATSCGANMQCNAGACAVCASDSACGASCTACGGSTPRCLAAGSTSSCVECLGDGDCTGGNVCHADGTCGPAQCALPSTACTTDTNASGDGCAQAKTVSRKAAMGTYTVTDSTCYNSDNFTSSGSSCWDANADFAYRIFLRVGESIHASVSTNWSCNQSSWSATLEVYESSGGGCSDMTCATRQACSGHGWSETLDYTAPADGWYTVVVDGSSAFDDNGDYDFSLTLSGCKDANCECP